MNAPTPELLAADRAGALHDHEDHTTLTGETRCTICGRPLEAPSRTN